MHLSNEVSDRVLVRQYLDGDDRAFEQLVSKHKNAIYTKVFMMVRDQDIAEDIFQDTFIKVINTLKSGRYNEEGKFLPWVMRIAHNLTIDHFRKNKKMPTVRGDDDYDVFATISQSDMHIEDKMAWEQILSDVKGLIKYLPDEQQQVVMMRHYYKMSFKEISEKLDISINTALGRMRYALINMRKLIDKHGIRLTMS
ncbi:RNA polymerase sigma factor [Halocola ammonii]